MVVRVGGLSPYLVQIEFQSAADRSLPERLLRYSVLLRARHDLPVQSVVVLMRRTAAAPRLSGRLTLRLPDGRDYLTFRYDVVRTWQQPVDRLLNGPVATLPLAPIGDVSLINLPRVVRRVEERLQREVPPATARELWSATQVLMGLRYSPEVIERMASRMSNWVKDSSVYQAWVREARTEEARGLLLRQGQVRFGAPDESTLAAIERITDLETLESLAVKLLTVANWDELLASAGSEAT